MILAELCQDYDFAVARGGWNFPFNTASSFSTTYTSSFSPAPGSGPYLLPTDWLRANRRDVFYTIQQVKYVMIAIDMAEFDALVQQPGLAAYPEYYAVDNSPIASQQAPVMFVWPPPAGAYPVSCRYFRQMPDIATPETDGGIAWFPNQNYLKKRLAGELMDLANDDRAEKFIAEAKDLLLHYLKMKDDDTGDKVPTVELDRRRFGLNFDRARNTKTIGWAILLPFILAGSISISFLTGGERGKDRSAAFGAQRVHAGVEARTQGRSQQG